MLGDGLLRLAQLGMRVADVGLHAARVLHHLDDQRRELGQAVGAAIYTNLFTKALIEKLPASEQANWSTIYLGGYLTQITYPVGSEVRNAINYAWGYSQKYECIAATAVLVLAIPAIAVWKNYNVDRKQNKGVVI